MVGELGGVVWVASIYHEPKRNSYVCYVGCGGSRGPGAVLGQLWCFISMLKRQPRVAVREGVAVGAASGQSVAVQLGAGLSAVGAASALSLLRHTQ